MNNITYTWSFHRLLSRPESPLPNTLRGVWWKLTAEDGLNTASMAGSYDLPLSDPKTFLPYEVVTKADLIAWTERELSKVHVETQFDSATQRMISTQPDGFDGNALELYRHRLAQELIEKAKPKPLELAIPE